MAENTNFEPDSRDFDDPGEAREPGARGAGQPNEVSGQPNDAVDQSGSNTDKPNDVVDRSEEGADEPNEGAAEREGGADQPEDEAGDQEAPKTLSETYQIFGKEFRDSQVAELDALLSNLDEDIEELRENKKEMIEALLAIPGSLPGTNLEEVAEAAAKAVEKRQGDFISRLEDLRGDIAEEVDFAKWRHELADERDRRKGKEDGGSAFSE